MRLLLFAGILAIATQPTFAQERTWIAPEGKILNYRTLTWEDFGQKEDKEFADKLAQQNLRAAAYVCPSIYFTSDSGRVEDNGRVKFRFKVKCAFQSSAFVRESTKQDHSNYVLIHEQDHYDIALTYANKLQADLSSRDYSEANYDAEISKIYDELLAKYHQVQELYDNEVNPDGRDDKEKQRLWDMRIKKCLENNTDEYYGSPETVAQTVKLYAQTVKRIPGEAPLQFAVRSRPLYTELPADMMPRVVETKEWGEEPSILAFYTQKYYVQEDGAEPKDNYRTLAFIFVPNGKNTYQRTVVDTFSNDGKPVKIAAAFFANADSDPEKELVIVGTSTQRDAAGTGTLYINRVYDNVKKPIPARLKKLPEAAAKIVGGFEGTLAGKAQKAKFKTEKEIKTIFTN